MWARKRIDIRWSDLAYGMVRCGLPLRRDQLERTLDTAWGADDETLACLSVRSGFDLLFAALDLPRGSEVLMSAVTIRDMATILEDHGLVPVPIDLDPTTMAPDEDALRAALSPATRAIVVAHLFGALVPLDSIHRIAHERGLLVIEDCAQAYNGDYRGHATSDVAMFSFGSIKTATALGGAVLRVADDELLARMRTLQSTYRVQSRWSYLHRLLKYSALKLTSSRAIFPLIVLACWLCRRDHDHVINDAVRGFAGPGFFPRIRRQPSTPLLALLAHRVTQFDRGRLRLRTIRGNHLAGMLAGVVERPGAAAEHPTYWVFPVLADDPAATIAALAETGFDATQGQSMCTVPAPAGRSHTEPRQARDVLAQTVYLPFYVEMSVAELERMAGVLLAVAAQQRRLAPAPRRAAVEAEPVPLAKN